MDRWANLQNEFNQAVYHLENDLKSAGYFDKLRYEAFSDTIMISLPVKNRGVGKDRGRNPIWWTLMSMGEMLIRLFRFAILNKFYFRGCISAGKFYRSELGSMTIGPAVDEAAEYHRLPEWSGVSTSPSASKILAEVKDMRTSLYHYFIQYDIPLKNRVEKKGWALNWPVPLRDDETSNIRIRQMLYDNLLGVNGISEYFKVRNTLEFFDIGASVRTG